MSSNGIFLCPFNPELRTELKRLYWFEQIEPQWYIACDIPDSGVTIIPPMIRPRRLSSGYGKCEIIFCAADGFS